MDLVIRGARVVDGTGRPWQRADVGIAGERIAGIGRRLSGARRIIDAGDRVLAPGFIDMHAHSDLSVLRTPLQEMKIAQGVTTELVAQDGLGCAPVSEEAKPRVAELVAGLLGDSPAWHWSTVAEYLDAVDRSTAVNVATLAPHATIRCDVLGGDDRPATESELAAMEAVVDTAMCHGAFGFSTGLEYEPTTEASTAEVTRLTAVAARRGGFYVTHVRDYDERFVEALDEAVAICRGAGAPLHYSHYHCYGRRNHGLGPDIRRRAEQARADGVDVSFDIYPYTAGTTYAHWFLSREPQLRTLPSLRAALADRERRAALLEALERDGMPIDIGWEDCFPGAGEHLVGAGGRSLGQIGADEGRRPGEVLVELAERSEFTATLNGVMVDAEDVDGTLAHRLATIGSDAILHGTRPHPRGWGAFAKVIRLYVVERGTMTIEEAVALMSGRPAGRLGLRDRGVVRPGAIADLVLFDPEEVRDRATYQEPTLPAGGFDHVWVGGRPVWEDGRATGETPGRGLRSAGAG
jgi:N-acyl-D-amino-acid deacylase